MTHTLKVLVMGYLQAEYFYFILILQQWQHIFYYSTWDSSAAAKVYTMSSSPHLTIIPALLQRVISWSSLDWDQGRWNQLDLVIGTTFDLSVHIANT